MSSIYQQLTESDSKVERDIRTLATPTLPPPSFSKPQLTGIKIALWGAYFMGLAALLGGVYLYYSIGLETQQRLSLESTHVALSKRTVALESAIEEQRKNVQNVGEKLNQTIMKDDGVQGEIRREIEKRRLEIVDLQKMMQSLQTGLSVSGNEAVVPNGAYGESLNPEMPPEEAVEAPPPAAEAGGVPVETSIVTGPDQMARVVNLSDPAPVAAAVPEVGTLAAPPVPPGPVASAQKILTVNRQFKFVVVNIGQADSAQVGDKLKVLRNGQQVGLIQIEKLYDSFSAAAILEEGAQGAIDVGDAIVKVA